MIMITIIDSYKKLRGHYPCKKEAVSKKINEWMHFIIITFQLNTTNSFFNSWRNRKF